MPKTLNEIIAALPPESRDRIERRSRELIRRASLQKPRKALAIIYVADGGKI